MALIANFPVIEEIEYIDNIQNLFLCFADQIGTLWLDSTSQSTLAAGTDRYSYLAVDPFKTYTLNAEQQPEKFYLHQPFSWLKPILQTFHQNKKEGIPPFQGGLAGYWSYDVGLAIEKSTYNQESHYQTSLPLFVLNLYDLVLAWDHLEKKAWIISTGFPEINLTNREKRAKLRLNWLLKILKKLETSHFPLIKNKRLINENSLKSNFSVKDYQIAVEKIKQYIYAGDVFQVNLSQQFTAELTSYSCYKELYLKLSDIHKAPFSAFYNFKHGIIASASPERFIRLSDKKIEARPIKGTMKRNFQDVVQDHISAQTLCKSSKDLAENTMIVDLMRNDISKISTINSVSVEKLCGLETFQTVHHLVSVIQAELAPNKDACDILQALFPGGSITGAPKVRAMEIIKELEPHRRGPYCGSLGFISFNGDMDTSILIRTLIIKNNSLSFCAGGGVVLDSSPKAEYEETLLKAQGLIQALKA